MADIAAFTTLARELDRIDVEVYAQFDKDPLLPIIGMGPPDCRLAIMGRDPGRHEVQLGVPFVGAGGQLVRRALYEAMHGEPMPDLQASLDIGAHVFWANTVPYKPVGNKTWGTRIQRRFAPLMADILVHDWQGSDVLALGRDAVMWFGLNDKAIKASLNAFWERDDRYEASIAVVVVASDGVSREVCVHPVPHPSPLNATWYRHVPRLLAARLQALRWGTQTWRVSP